MMATADLITAFLSNELSPEREREFLLSVAASDALRLELKSHLMLDRMMVQRVNSVHVPDAVRTTIFAQAGVPVGASTPGAPDDVSSGARAASVARPGFFSRFVGRATLFVTTLAVFGAGYALGTDSDSPSSSEQLPGVSAPSLNSSVQDAENAVAPSSIDVEPGVDANSQASGSRTAPNVIEGKAISGSGERRTATNDMVNSSPVVTEAPNLDPSSPSSDADRRAPYDSKRGRSAQISVDGKNRPPTDEERARQTNPLEGGGPVVK